MIEQLDLLAPTHTSDPETSRKAARRAAESMEKYWTAIVAALASAVDGLTADEMVDAVGFGQRHVVQTRAGEMTKEHLRVKRFPVPLLVRTERKRNTSPAGMGAVVYELTTAGVEQAARLKETA